jgi:hypothetical protein
MTPKHIRTLIHIVSLLIALAGGVLAIGDTIKAIPGLPPNLANSWPMFLAGATAVDRIGGILVSEMTKWLVNDEGEAKQVVKSKEVAPPSDPPKHD